MEGRLNFQLIEKKTDHDQRKSQINVPHWILSFDENIVEGLPSISINVLRDTQLPSLWVDVKERMLVVLVKTIRQRVKNCAEVRTVGICGNNLK